MSIRVRNMMTSRAFRFPTGLNRSMAEEHRYSMVSVIESLLRNPSVDRYLSFRYNLLRKIPSEQRDRLVLGELEDLLEKREWHRLIAAVDRVYDAWQLSPRIHFLLGIASAETGDLATSDRCRAQMQVLLKVLLSTGDGTIESPFTITYASDAYDVARAVGFRPVRHRLVEVSTAALRREITGIDDLLPQRLGGETQPGRLCDVLIDASGDELWFEVTEILLGRSSTSSRQPVRRAEQSGSAVASDLAVVSESADTGQDSIEEPALLQGETLLSPAKSLKRSARIGSAGVKGKTAKKNLGRKPTKRTR
ncbi:MAG: DUF4919 domain-containing protein [Planctomycetota bacterium]|nr:DUF4919 domain-containing protein [Planctomycetota bacterium]